MAPQNEPLTATQVARIAVYDDLLSAPRIVEIQPTDAASYIDSIASTTYEKAASRGGVIPYTVIREVSENFIHAQFKEVIVSVLDRGNTIRFADQGPGIENKDRAQMPGFSSATSEMKEFIRGVGSGLPIVKEYLKFSNGRLVIEDNIKDGTVITIAVDPNASTAQPVIYQEAPVMQTLTQAAIYAQPNPIAAATYAQPAAAAQAQVNNAAITPAFTTPATTPAATTQTLEARDFDVLALATEGNIGPTEVANALGLATATAYRILDKLQKGGYLMSDENHRGKRVLTQLGLETLRG